MNPIWSSYSPSNAFVWFCHFPSHTTPTYEPGDSYPLSGSVRITSNLIDCFIPVKYRWSSVTTRGQKSPNPKDCGNLDHYSKYFVLYISETNMPASVFSTLASLFLVSPFMASSTSCYWVCFAPIRLGSQVSSAGNMRRWYGISLVVIKILGERNWDWDKPVTKVDSNLKNDHNILLSSSHCPNLSCSVWQLKECISPPIPFPSI